MGGKVREVERKWDVGSAFVVPPLEGVAGVASVTGPETIELEAIYYDAGDLRLLRARTTLRRRTGGPDEGWHLKLPVAPGVRDEIQRPLTASREVPDELADLVLVRLLGAPLRPVARLATTRKAWTLLDAEGIALAEVVDDDVSAQTLGATTELSRWRELEVELVKGGRALLTDVGEVLRAAGAGPSAETSKLGRVLGSALEIAAAADTTTAPPLPAVLDRRTPAGEVVRAYLTTQLDALIVTDPLVRLDEPDSVHRMRVASRRLRSSLRTFAPMLDASRAAALDVELKDLATALSGARDQEVMKEHFDSQIAALPPELVLGPVAARIAGHLGADLAASRQETLTALRDDRYVRLIGDLRTFVATAGTRGPGLKRAHKVLPKLVGRADLRLARAVAAIRAAEPGHDRDEAYHQARKKAKRLRYAAEAVVPVFGTDAKTLASLAAQTQEVLGTHQDAIVARDQLRMWGVQAQNTGGESAFTFGLLLGREENRAEAAERAFDTLWREVSDPVHRAWLDEKAPVRPRTVPASGSVSP